MSYAPLHAHAHTYARARTPARPAGTRCRTWIGRTWDADSRVDRLGLIIQLDHLELTPSARLARYTRLRYIAGPKP